MLGLQGLELRAGFRRPPPLPGVREPFPARGARGGLLPGAGAVGERVGTGLVARYSADEPPGLSVNLERRKGLEAAPRARVEGILRALEANE